MFLIKAQLPTVLLVALFTDLITVVVAKHHFKYGYERRFRRGGSYFAIHPDGAPDGCSADAGTQVDDSCCTSLAPQPSLTEMFDFPCYATTDLLSDGVAVGGYFGCDNGVPTYGESCAGLLPPGTDLGPFNNNAGSLETCNLGCSFSVSGTGCFKINDFTQIPQYAADTRSFFVYLDPSTPCRSNLLTDPQPLPSQSEPGPFYAIYPDTAPDGCQAEAGTKVPTSCCIALGPQPLATSFAETPCFASGGLAPDGSVVGGYLGCDNGVQTYGERCVAGGLLPSNTDLEPLNTFVDSIDECNAGCAFQISGKGCYKINDFSANPQFSTDTRQFYIYLDGPRCVSNGKGGKRGGSRSRSRSRSRGSSASTSADGSVVSRVNSTLPYFTSTSADGKGSKGSGDDYWGRRLRQKKGSKRQRSH